MTNSRGKKYASNNWPAGCACNEYPLKEFSVNVWFSRQVKFTQSQLTSHASKLRSPDRSRPPKASPKALLACVCADNRLLYLCRWLVIVFPQENPTT